MSSPAPEIRITPSPRSPSTESFEVAAPNNAQWNLIPYWFNCCPLPLSTNFPSKVPSKNFDEIASIRLPEYHLLVDHTLGVAWKSICNGRKHIGQMTPEQLLWAVKLIESHRGKYSQYSEDVGRVIQYLQEIVLAMSVNAHPEPLSRHSESVAPAEDSFVLANMSTEKPAKGISALQTPAAASTPFMGRTPTDGKTRKVVIENLKSLQGMLIDWKRNQMRSIKTNIVQLEAIEQMLKSTGAGEDSRCDDQLATEEYCGTLGRGIVKRPNSHSPQDGTPQFSAKPAIGRGRGRRSSLNC